MLGDGNLYCNNKGQYVIRITGDLNKDKKYHEDFISNLFYGLFNKEMRVQIYPDRRVLCCYSKHIFDQLISFGLKHGNKLENNVYIPDWIFDDDRYVMACLRGLIDTDGSVFPKSTNKEFFQIEISCANPSGVRPATISRFPCISPRHQSRALIWGRERPETPWSSPYMPWVLSTIFLISFSCLAHLAENQRFSRSISSCNVPNASTIPSTLCLNSFPVKYSYKTFIFSSTFVAFCFS